MDRWEDGRMEDGQIRFVVLNMSKWNCYTSIWKLWKFPYYKKFNKVLG